MPTIPKLIIQTGKDRHLRPIEKAAVGTLRLLHPEPEWKYLFFGDNDINAFIAREFPEYRETFRSFPRVIQRIDFFRYLAIFRLGGFYFDLDVFLYEKINDLCAKSCVFPFEELTLSQFLRERHKLDWEIGNYAFGAAPGSPFLKAAIENCIRSQRDA
jgi:mannosyltransferase OCH1-like enzyme